MKLLLVDGNAVLHRAYYALPDWRNRSGEAIAGVYGFLSMSLKAIAELQPTHLAIVFDTPEPTFRHLMYVGYQVNREKERQVSEDIWGQVEKLKIVWEKAGVPVFNMGGFEADDILGTLAMQAVGHGGEAIIITGDRDLMQLVSDQVKLFMPQRGMSDGMIIGKEEVKQRLGINPELVVDYKALVGDSSDNYPGVPGIGPKTAVMLLEKYGGFDLIYKALTQGEDNKNRDKLIAGYESGKLSQQLATIKRDVPVHIDWEKAQVPTEEKIISVLTELGYKSLIKRITGEEVKLDESQQKLFE